MYQSTDDSSAGKVLARIVRLDPTGTATVSPEDILCRGNCVTVSTKTKFRMAMLAVGDVLGVEEGKELAGVG